MARNIRVVKNDENPETPEVLAESIIRISEGFKQLTKEGLTDRAIVTLLLGMDDLRGGKVSQTSAYLVLENLPKLASYYVRKQPTK